MMTLSAFADEIATDFPTQLAVLRAHDVRHVDVRGAWGINVLKLSDAQVADVQRLLVDADIAVACIGSPIGKIGIADDFDAHLRDFERAIDVAARLGTRYIRVFSFFMPEDTDPSEMRAEVMARMTELTRRAEAAKVYLLHENEKHIYGDTPERCLDLLSTMNSPHLRLAFDPANFVQCGVRPMQDAYPLLCDHIEYVHIKDAHLSDGRVVPAGHGDGGVPELLRALADRGYEGILSLEPHLESANALAGFSGPDLFKVAADALKQILDQQTIPWQ